MNKLHKQYIGHCEDCEREVEITLKRNNTGDSSMRVYCKECRNIIVCESRG
jgi:hypothetical protein